MTEQELYNFALNNSGQVMRQLVLFYFPAKNKSEKKKITMGEVTDAASTFYHVCRNEGMDAKYVFNHDKFREGSCVQVFFSGEIKNV